LGVTVEREAKFRITSWEEGEAQLKRAGGRVLERRYFETNSLYDFPEGTLRKRGQALRIRRARDAAWLTFKEPARGSGGIKHRHEYETSLEDPDAVERILTAIGMDEQFRYEKYREVYALADVEACLDETPIGFYIELEGLANAIEAAVLPLKLSMDDAIVASYPELYREYRRQLPTSPRFMIFAEDR
jgi:adenylate cyclase class 2